MIRIMAVLLGCLLVLSGCGGGGGSSTPTAGTAVTTESVSGKWSGTLTTHWSDGDSTDAFVMEFTQTGTDITGTFTVGTESPVNVTGTVSGADFTFSGVLTCAGNNTVQFGGTVSGNTLTITSASGTGCDGATLLGASGTLTLVPTATTNALLNGTYIVNLLMDDEVGLSQGGYTLAVRAEIIFDGAGNFTYTELGSSTGIDPGGSGTYAVAADGTFTTSMGDTGIVAADGNSLTWADTDASDNAVAIFVGIKKGTGLSNAVLNGTYVLSSMVDDEVELSQGGYSMTILSEMTFDGAGNVTGVDFSRSAGTMDNFTTTYSVASDGTLTLGGGAYTGIVSQGGTAFSTADTDLSDNMVAVNVGIKKGSGLSNATLNGTYVVNMYMDDEVDLSQGGHTIVDRMELTFDGAGNGTFITLASSEGGASSGSFTYSVAADGTFTTVQGDTGIVHMDGNSLVWADTDASDNAIAIFVGIKKSL